MTDDVVIVLVKPGSAPRQFTAEFLGLVDRAAKLPGRGPVEVQVFSLLMPSRVDLKCDKAGLVLTPEGPSALPATWLPLSEGLPKGKLVCLAAPFEVRLPTVGEGRPYAGVFRRDVPAPYVPAQGMTPTEREQRARSGSEAIFRTTRLGYVAGVLASEDASIVGEPRAALARVISHNADTLERHGSRPVCDTTHCQVGLHAGPPGLASPPVAERARLRTG